MFSFLLCWNFFIPISLSCGSHYASSQKKKKEGGGQDEVLSPSTSDYDLTCWCVELRWGHMERGMSLIQNGWCTYEMWARHRGLKPIILPTQETEFRRIMVQSQPQENSLWDPISEKNSSPKMSCRVAQSKSACLSRVRPWVQTPVLPLKKNIYIYMYIYIFIYIIFIYKYTCKGKEVFYPAASEGAWPSNTLTLYFQPPELWHNSFLSVPWSHHSGCSIVLAALGR
jgi:hypothetical protein